ncbi:uncharacterized protein K460DRAFT_415889 [Cucurbitaria berberidis CBS 394.84]|uniref:Fungal N-terminal domain-containing protein n=1 Tax=Cucurbitaria berberidis CBS 394.84 TaxID=1168544 RepID=A0A9P4LCV7_9PLEO|nr:uncharacterized protein K460DRAFT_415889 [Cucurbitaria berberidis CBS 394.84]KAF1849544.1 hypothetical protein K460DRAFT_415889 [Cucurbitaria berberidis CBS 394.84]
MSGLEIFGAVGAAATLLELAKKCSQRLEKIENTDRDIIALQKRVRTLTETITQVSDVLYDIRRQNDGQVEATEAEVAVWSHMDAVLKLCNKTLGKLNTRLDSLHHKHGKSKLSALPPDILRRTDDLSTYISVLSTLKGLFQLIFQSQQAVAQKSMHRAILDIRQTQESTLDGIRRGIDKINDQMQQQEKESPPSRSDSLLSFQPRSDIDAEITSLSDHLNGIMIAVTGVQKSRSVPRAPAIRSPDQSIPLNTSLSASTLASNEAKSLAKDSLPDITHVEPLRELAQRFKKQAEYDLEHRKYKDAVLHQLEAIECFRELHDAHNITFESYHDMMMVLAGIYKKLNNWEDAEKILKRAAKQPLTYEHTLGWKSTALNASLDTDHRAVISHHMAELLLEKFTSASKSLPPPVEGTGDHWVPLHEAESQAKRAFRIRRDHYGKDHDDFKKSVLLLVDIYTKFREKQIYVETYNDLYILDNEHRHNALLSSPSETNTSRSRSLVPSNNSDLVGAVKDHAMPFDDVISNISGATLDELEQIVDGKSIMMIAMDCISRGQCDRCEALVDKLLRLEVDRDAPFSYAVKRKRTENCRFLLRHGANINWLDSNGLTPLMHAIKLESFEMVVYLLSEGANVNITGVRGQSALHVSTQERNEWIFELLLKQDGLDIDATDDNGLTAMHLCAKQNNIGFARKLVHAGANLEIKDKSGRDRTPLWIAVKEDKYDFARMLLKSGAKVDLKSLPQSRSSDVRHLLKKHQSREISSGSGT